MSSSYKVYEKLLRRLKVPDETMSTFREQITESATFAKWFSMARKHQHPADTPVGEIDNLQRLRQTECQALIFRWCIFESVQELVRSDPVFAAKHEV